MRLDEITELDVLWNRRPYKKRISAAIFRGIIASTTIQADDAGKLGIEDEE